MTYNPYPQQDPSSSYQPYQPYPTQQPYQPYPAQQPYPVYAQAPPPSGGSSKIMIIVVVVIIVIIAFTVITAGILVVYMQSFSSGPGNTLPSASLLPTPFTNPYDGSGTTNGGGWTVQVAAISSSKTLLSEVTVSVLSNGVTVAKLTSVSTTSASLSYTSSSMEWFLLKSSGGTLKFMDSSTAKNLDTTTAKNVDATELQTVQGAYLVFIDNNKDGYLSAGDLVIVYSDVNADGTAEITSGCRLQLSMTGTPIASTNLP